MSRYQLTSRVVVIRLCAAIVCLTAQTAAAQTTALVGARVIDGRGQVIESGTIIVTNGRITSVGPAASTAVPPGAQRVESAGLTIMPGLVNAHGHLTGAVGMRNDRDGYTRENLLRQLETYAGYGITTVFSLGDDQAEAFQIRSEQSKGIF
ncbi:MAG: hypothetical protein M3478_07770, partial [Planctomycetota bacterium]|nr:hypothetical protein [Planctomycetota bacterium]